MAQEEVVAFHRCAPWVDFGYVPGQGDAPRSQHPLYFELGLLGRECVSRLVHQLGEWCWWFRERGQVLKGLRNLKHIDRQLVR